MLPVAAGRDATRKQILAYTLVLVPVGLLPTILGFAGLAYGVAALAAGAGLLHLALRLHRQSFGRDADEAAKKLFGFSILYLTILFGVLLLERVTVLILTQVAS
jgi:protoheme IX farnesyltransferase